RSLLDSWGRGSSALSSGREPSGLTARAAPAARHSSSRSALFADRVWSAAEPLGILRAWSVRRRMRARQRFGERWPASGTSGVTPLLLVRWPFQLPFRSEGNGSMLPLEGVTVVSLEQAVAAPFATRQLADLGARVIKVERPGGDFARAYDTAVNGMSSHFVWLNRNKESLVVDLKTTDGQRVVRKLLDRADVFVQNLAPGAAARLGLGAAELRERNPRLVVCDISGYGSSGPYRDKKAYDLLIQCETGLVSITGNEAEPAKTGISVADIAGGMYAFSGVLTALYERERTGEGTAFEVSLF